MKNDNPMAPAVYVFGSVSTVSPYGRLLYDTKICAPGSIRLSLKGAVLGYHATRDDAVLAARLDHAIAFGCALESVTAGS